MPAWRRIRRWGALHPARLALLAALGLVSLLLLPAAWNETTLLPVFPEGLNQESTAARLWMGDPLATEVQQAFARQRVVAEAWQQGQLPVWSTSLSFGDVVWADAGYKALMPVRWPAYLPGVDMLAGWDITVWLQIAGLLLVTVGFLRHLRLRPLAIAVVLFGLALNPAISLLALKGELMFLIVLVALLWQSEKLLADADQIMPRIGLALAVGALWLSGGAWIPVLAMLFWAGYVVARLVYRWWHHHRQGSIWPLLKTHLSFMLIGLLLAMPQWYPSLLLAFEKLSYGATLRELLPELSGPPAVDWRALAALVVMPFRWVAAWQFETAEIRLPMAEAGWYLGWVWSGLLLLTWLLRFQRRLVWFLSLGLLTSWLGSWLWPTYAVLFRATAVVMAGWLVAIGVDAVLHEIAPRRRWVGVVLAGLVVAELLWSRGGILPTPTLDPEDRATLLDEHVAADTLVLEPSLADVLSGRTLSIQSPRYAYFAPALLTELPGRAPHIQLDDWTLDLTGRRLLQAPDWASWLAQGGAYISDADNPAAWQVRTTTPTLRIENRDALPMAYLAYVVKPYGTRRSAREAIVERAFDPAKEVVVETQGNEEGFDALVAGPSTPSIAPVEAMKDSARERTYLVKNSQSTVLVDMALYQAGWQVWVDGERHPMLPVNGWFRGVLLKPGDHEVVFRYDLTSLWIGLAGSTVSLLILLGWGIRTLRQRRHAIHDLEETFHVV